jgi:acetoin utilization deacetylase AcuC-like enzyme
LAGHKALEDGFAANLSGGFHHAYPGHGEGFCMIHDVGVAIRSLQAAGKIRTAMTVDTDVHHGNGTAAIFANDPSVFTLSIHQENNYLTKTLAWRTARATTNTSTPWKRVCSTRSRK